MSDNLEGFHVSMNSEFFWYNIQIHACFLFSKKNQLFIGCVNKRGLIKKIKIKKRPKPMMASDYSHSFFFASPFFLRWGSSGGKPRTSYWQHSNCWSGPIRSYIANEAPNVEAGHGLCKPTRP